VPQKNFANFVAGKNIEIVSSLQVFNNDSNSTQLVFCGVLKDQEKVI